MILSKEISLREIFSNNLRFYRIQNKLTQSELAEKINLTEKYISSMECGLYSASFDTLEELAFVLNIAPYELIKYDPSHMKTPNRLDKLTGTRKKRNK